jgi:hypothetical protein
MNSLVSIGEADMIVYVWFMEIYMRYSGDIYIEYMSTIFGKTETNTFGEVGVN